jgi:hypothetical protein
MPPQQINKLQAERRRRVGRRHALPSDFENTLANRLHAGNPSATLVLPSNEAASRKAAAKKSWNNSCAADISLLE